MYKTAAIVVLSVLCLVMAGYIVFSGGVGRLNILSGKAKKDTLDTVKSDAVLENILSRKSVRHYVEGKTITQEQYEKILRAGMAAPTARNTQPWEFIVVDDKNILNSLGDKIKTGAMLKNASGAIIVLGNLDKTPDMTEFWTQDTSAATQNILLEIEALGLGAVWIGTYPIEDRISVVREEFKLPARVIPLSIISIGYPTGEDKPKDKWKKENIRYNKY